MLADCFAGLISTSLGEAEGADLCQHPQPHLNSAELFDEDSDISVI